MIKRWIVKQLKPQAVGLGKKYGLSPIIVQILLNREVVEEKFLSFLNPSLNQLYSPFLLPDMEKAIQRIREAVRRREKIYLFGDYDVDGITSLLVFYEYIKDFSLPTSFYIPHRIQEGYGLNKIAMKKMREEGASLILCFDCGTNCWDEIAYANSLGMDVIVIDHHIPKGGLEYAYAFINPKRQDCSYPFPDLSSAGIAFKLVQGLKENMELGSLDLVAMSVVCDVVPLREENRVFLKEGLRWLKNTSRLGIEAICEVARIKPKNIEPYHIGYILGPRINACGRVSQASQVLELFTSPDANYVRKIAIKVDEYNRLRRSIEDSIFGEAEEIVEKELRDSYAFVLHKQGWHPGVLGIVASRLVEKYYRPTFVIGIEDRKGKGSARSINDFHLLEALETCKDYLSSFGGHRKAAGIEILEHNLESFKAKINAVTEEKLREKELRPQIEIDLELEFKDIELEWVAQLERLKPFGEENSPPLFLTRRVMVRSLPKRTDGGVYNFWITDGDFTYQGIFYPRDGFLDTINCGKRLDIVYRLEVDYYNNTPRLIIKDLKLSRL
jgi:single-stranded-DNA-specific exonuclease